MPNERDSNSYHMAKLKKMGLKAGISDLVFIYSFDRDINVLFLELKRKDGRQSPAQKEFQKQIDESETCGYLVYELAYSFKEAKEIIERYIL